MSKALDNALDIQDHSYGYCSLVRDRSGAFNVELTNGSGIMFWTEGLEVTRD